MLWDAVAKRQAALAVFLACIAIKAYHLFHLSESVYTNEGLWLFWVGMDFIFLVGLRLANVPSLRFTWVATAGLVFVAAMLDFGVAVGWFGNSNSLAASEILAAGLALGAGSAAANSSHIQGSYLVKVVPPTIAKLNPNATNYCLSPSTLSSHTIPLQIKGTPPYFIDYEFISLTSLKPKKFTNVTITGEAKRSLAVYPIAVSTPGVYRLTGLRDSTGMQGRILETVTEVAVCPDAEWIVTEKSKRAVDICVDDESEFSVKVVAGGTGPVQVYYSRKTDSEEVIVRLESEVTDQQSQPPLWIGDDSVPETLRPRVLALKPRTSIIKGSFKPDTPGPHFFKLLYVTDSRNFTVLLPSASPPPQSLTGTIVHTVSGSRHPDLFVIDAHAHPSIRFTSSEANKIRAPPTGGEFTPTTLPVVIENSGTGPFTFTVAHSLTVQDAQEGKHAKTWTETAPTTHHSIQVHQPGVYTLHTLHDTFCAGTVSTPHLMIVEQTFPPTIQISKYEALKQSCVGSIGARVNVSLTGDAPFLIHYDEVYKGVRTRHVATVEKLRDTLEFKPVLPGKYLYEFVE
ncbi:hypothetical protein HDU98_002814, partial [Podochytrium sp. JEL0797]